MKVKLRINKMQKRDRDAREMEIIDGKQYISLNILIDSGVDGGILDTETAECYEFDWMSSWNMGIITVTGTERREFKRNTIPMRTVEGALVNAEAIQIKDIGNEKPNSSVYIRKLNEEFGWDTKISRHFEQPGQ